MAGTVRPNVPARPSLPGKPPTDPNASFHIWLVVLGSLLLLNLMVTIMLCFRVPQAPDPTADEAPPPPANVQILIRVQQLETELAKFRFEIAKQKSINQQLQNTAEALQLQVARIPPPNVPSHAPSALPVVEPAVETR